MVQIWFSQSRSTARVNGSDLVRFGFRSAGSSKAVNKVRRFGSVDSVKPSQLGQNWSTRRVDSVNSTSQRSGLGQLGSTVNLVSRSKPVNTRHGIL
ncbi:hypothetical protein HanOQP8_Chr11g0403031 [Helianthus annuus]|nr:hypothetical protein HanOQP8_Chr11g0403031 [Helianthus annuus]